MAESIAMNLPFLFGRKVQAEEDIEISPTKNGPSGSGYGPIISDKFDIEFESAKKKVSRFCVFAIIVNSLLFLYVGPTPWAKHIKFANNDMKVIFTCWDALIAIVSTLILFMGLSKKTMSKTAGIRGYCNKILILTILQALTSLFIIIFVEFSSVAFESLLLRIISIAMNLFVWHSSKTLITFYESNRPTFGI